MDFTLTERQQKVASLEDTNILDILHTLWVQKVRPVVPGVTKENIKTGAILRGFTQAQLIRAVLSYNNKKRAEPVFAEKILARTSQAIFSVGKITTVSGAIQTDYLVSDGCFLHDKEVDTQKLSTVYSAVSAALTVNPVEQDKAKELNYVKADARGDVYPAVDVLTVNCPVAKHYAGLEEIKMVPRNMRAAIASKIAKNTMSLPFYRDVLLSNITPPMTPATSSYAMTQLYRYLPAEENLEVARFHESLGQPYIGGIRSPISAPKFKEMPPSADPLKNVWITHEKYRAVSGGDSGFISNFTNGYYLGDLGPDYEMVVPWAMDVLEFMRVGKYDVAAKTSDKKFNRLWPILACNTLVHDESSPPYATYGNPDDPDTLPKTGTYNMAPLHGHKVFKFRRGGMMTAPNVNKQSVKYTDSDDANDDICNSIISSTFTHVLTFAYPSLWQQKNFFVSPTRMPHTNMVWINESDGDVERRYGLQTHCDRTIHAIQWKTYYPFHRRIYAAADKLANIFVQVVRIGKLLPVPFDDLVENGFLLDDEYRQSHDINPNYEVVVPNTMRKNIVPDAQMYNKMNEDQMYETAMRKVTEDAQRRSKKKAECVMESEAAPEPEVKQRAPPAEAAPDENDI